MPTESPSGTPFDLIDYAPFGLHRYQLLENDRLIFIGANATADAMLGIDHRTFFGKTIEEAFPALAETEIPTRYREVARTRQPWQTDRVFYDEQGITGAFDVRAVPFAENEVTVYFLDVTERLKTEHALRATQRELDTYFTHALDLLCIASTDGKFRRLNPEWERVLGYPISELEGESFLKYVHPDDLTATLAAISQLKHQTSVIDFVNRYQHRDGSYRSIEWRSFPSGESIYAIAHDVTERNAFALSLENANRELTLKTKELESLLYVTTHDLRSPLVNVLGFSSRIERVATELLELTTNPQSTKDAALSAIPKAVERLRSSLDYITKSAQKMDRLISALLQLSRLGRRQLQQADVDMNALFHRVMAVQQHQLTDAAIEIELGDLPTCYGDIGQLDQVLSNLLDNAIKYRDKARPCTVTVSGKTEPDGSLTYRFSDTGRGIAQEHIERIWELFHRLSPDSDLPGDGIGLTAARQIIQRHGGTISVESEPNVGTTFVIHLPGKCKSNVPNQKQRSHD